MIDPFDNVQWKWYYYVLYKLFYIFVILKYVHNPNWVVIRNKYNIIKIEKVFIRLWRNIKLFFFTSNLSIEYPCIKIEGILFFQNHIIRYVTQYILVWCYIWRVLLQNMLPISIFNNFELYIYSWAPRGGRGQNGAFAPPWILETLQ